MSSDTKTDPVRVWELDDGATYWIAAPTLREALRLYFACLDLTGEGITDSLTIDEAFEGKSRTIEIVEDNGTSVNAWDLARRDGPGVLGCSEWP